MQWKKRGKAEWRMDVSRTLVSNACDGRENKTEGLSWMDILEGCLLVDGERF